MSQTSDILHDDARFDRLVDGELTRAEYEELLAALDNQPDGWRRCALAFLEAQAWEGDLRAFRAGEDLSARFAAVTLAPRQTTPKTSLLLATAASLLVAFGLGLAVRGWWPANHSPPVADQGAREPEKSLADSRDDSPGENLREPPEVPSSKDPHNRPWGSMTLVVDRGDGSAEEIDLPVYDYRDDYAKWLMDNTTPVPLEVRQKLRRLGYQVRRGRQWTRVYVDQGRPVFLPVDEVEITPVSSRSFQ